MVIPRVLVLIQVASLSGNKKKNSNARVLFTMPMVDPRGLEPRTH